MSINSIPFLRHITIDSCLRDKSRKYSINDLIKACNQAISKHFPAIQQENKNSEKTVSLRTLQLDLQFMRDKTEGYGAPIVVYDGKYYKYNPDDFTIIKSKLRGTHKKDLKEIAAILKNYSQFNELESLKSVINILNEELEAKIEERESVISYEGKRNPLGMEYFDTIHDAIIHKKVLCIGYYSSRSNNIIPIIFYPFYLKEYKGRWYAFGYKDGLKGIYKLPLDRIRDYSYAVLPFPKEYKFNPHQYFNDIVGITRLSGEIKEITLLVKNKLAPYINLNPIHNSQEFVEKQENGDYLFKVNLIPNREFYSILIDFFPNVTILSPKEVGLELNGIIKEHAENLPDYHQSAQNKETQIDESWEGTLFSDI